MRTISKAIIARKRLQCGDCAKSKQLFVNITLKQKVDILDGADDLGWRTSTFKTVVSVSSENIYDTMWYNVTYG